MDFPDTTLIKRAEAYVRPLLSKATLSHSERSFLYGREYGRVKKLHFDEETLYLASLFHDVGLGRPEKGKVFQEVSCDHVSRFLGNQDIEANSAMVHEAIMYHVQVKLRVGQEDNTAAMLQVGTWMDGLGLRKRTLPMQVRKEIAKEHAGPGFLREMTSHVVFEVGVFSFLKNMAGRVPDYSRTLDSSDEA